MYLNKISVCFYLHTLNLMRFFSSFTLANTRKYLNRKEDKVITNDESTYIAKIGKKSELRDVMDVHVRSFSLGLTANDTESIMFQDRLKLKQKEKPTGWLGTKKSIRWALDAAGNTGQFIKYTNMKIEQHNDEIQNIKKLHDKFDREVEMLQSQKLEQIFPDKKTLGRMDIREITSMLNQLLLGKRNSKSKLKKLEDNCSLVERELEYQEFQIEDFRQLIKEFQYQKINSSHESIEINALNTIKNELDYLSKDKNVDKLSNAIDVLASSLDVKY